MGLWDKLRGELIDIIEWLDPTQNTLVYRFDRRDNEIKYSAKLIVRESQMAVFVNQGQLADVFGPGIYTLETRNLPILSTLLGWKYGFHSPFKAEVYFVSTRNFTDLKWGTQNPVMLRDAEFGPVRLRAFGTYAMRATDPAALIREIAGTDGRFTVEEITEQLRNLIVSRFADLLGESKIPVLDLAANYNELGEFIATKIRPEFQAYGLDVTKLLVENISLPPAVEEALDRRSSMGIVGDLSKYTQFQAADAIKDAAQNPGGVAGAGVGMGAGFAIGNQMARAMNQPPSGEAGGPPPLPAGWYIAVEGRQTGPVNMETMRGMIASGKLTRSTLVWSQGMAGWAAASTVTELAPLFVTEPPPLPPATPKL